MFVRCIAAGAMAVFFSRDGTEKKSADVILNIIVDF